MSKANCRLLVIRSQLNEIYTNTDKLVRIQSYI